MSDMSDDFHQVIRLEEMREAKHASLSREELESHLQADHGIKAFAEMDLDGSVIVKTSNMLGETHLRASHRRFHELTVEQGR